MSSKYSWISLERKYEGFPLFLRRPINLNAAALHVLFPTLAVLTHKFSKRTPDGLPEADYNNSLLDFDIEIVRAMDTGDKGVPVLVETFGGERNYYFYVATDTNIENIFSPIAKRYSNERLTWLVRSDPKWGFIEKYAKEFFDAPI